MTISVGQFRSLIGEKISNPKGKRTASTARTAARMLQLKPRLTLEEESGNLGQKRKEFFGEI